MTSISRRTLVSGTAAGLAATAASTGPARADVIRPRLPRPYPEPTKVPEAIGTGGAVSCVDPYAAEVGITVLRAGGNAVDAAIATAATLGVTEPFSCGIGGGGFLVYHHAASGRSYTINGRETAPATYTSTTFTDADGDALDFNAVVNSGLSVGIPGTLATWDVAARRFGTRPLGSLLRPAEALARRGFEVDSYFASHVESNAERFAVFPATAQQYLPGGSVPAIGDRMANPDLANTYALIRTQGIAPFYSGQIARAIVKEVRNPSTRQGVSVFKGQMTAADLKAYTAPLVPVTRSPYRGLQVVGMQVPSSGGIAVGEILNLLTAYERKTGQRLADLSEAEYLHWFSEACATAFADRNRWVGDVAGVPTAELLSPAFARERAQLFDPTRAQARPIPFGYPDGDYTTPDVGMPQGQPNPGQSTTHLNVVDRWGNVVSYTLTIEQTGGSAITVPGHGFLLNNELTDFNFVPLTEGVPDPNLPGPGKRPRSSMSPTILLDRGSPRLSVGTPGGATIITTVAQIITGYLDRGLDLVDAVAAPRLSSRNGSESSDQGLATSDVGKALTAMGHTISSTSQIGNASGIAFEAGALVAAAETVRGAGGAARVVRPTKR